MRACRFAVDCRILFRRRRGLSIILGFGCFVAAHPAVSDIVPQWQAPPSKVTLLAVAAHPDDEAIFFGGALPYYAAVLQVPTMLISMTSGESGGTDPSVREEELLNAAWIYGLRCRPLFGHFPDVALSNKVRNAYPRHTIDATWDSWADGVLQGDGGDVAAGRTKAVNFLAEQIRRYRPEVIITHALRGEYGHDNHKATTIAVIEAFSVAADPAAAPNLAGLPPWQTKKLYVHLCSTNKLFHSGWEERREELGGRTAREAAKDGLLAHGSQRQREVSTCYLKHENYDGYDSEWWGLYASTVGPDTRGTNGYATGNFLEHLLLTNGVNRSPAFLAPSFVIPSATAGEPYEGETLAMYATDTDKVAGDKLTFSKISGAPWLAVAPNGMLSGSPASRDEGSCAFVARVTDAAGASAEAAVRVTVLPRLLAWWSCGTGKGVAWADATACHHDGKLVNGPSWTNSPRGTALCFDGVDDHVEAPNLDLGPDLTIAAWLNSANLSGNHPILAKNGVFSFKTSDGSLRFTIPGLKDHTSGSVLTTGQWYHVAITFKAGQREGCRFYVNGRQVAAVDASAKSRAPGLTWISRDQWDHYFAGLLDDVRVYRCALDAAEVKALWKSSGAGRSAREFNASP